jgi:uncharacterized protein
MLKPWVISKPYKQAKTIAPRLFPLCFERCSFCSTTGGLMASIFRTIGEEGGTEDMLFAIHTLDGEGALPKRLEHGDAHRAHIAGAAGYGVKIVISGPLVMDDGETMIGSLIVIKAANREAAERFNANDPYRLAGVWQKVTISGFLKRQDNR